MNVIIFLGPTLAHELARNECDAHYAEPAAQGDIYRAVLEQPFAIGLIDGYFERLPSVWHKEILWALNSGVHVFGAASMGALRAAELARFGMRGVGAIFEAYRDGELEDDDEVAVLHGDRASGYRATSEAMVNIRATLRAAERAGVIGKTTHAQLLALGKGSFYPDRSYPLLLTRAREVGCPAAELAALKDFIPTGRVDQKRVDALALLHAVRDCVNEGRPPEPSRFYFSHTDAWQQVMDWAEQQPPLGAPEPTLSAQALAAEVRLLGARGEAMLARALAQVGATLALPPPGSLGASSTAAETPLDRMRDQHPELVHRQLLEEARRSGQYEALERRALAKQRFFEQQTHSGASAERTPEPGELLEWYCRERLARSLPDSIESLLSELCVVSRDAFLQEVRREFEFSRATESNAGA